ncbi:polysaccharide deacetylase family protein [Arthrobacter sp. NPDC097144]|uniref:polysaccharide deacetylase family protein n=1 Tax=Arthrobacter sp. NPDC097144 TaxID=3363946 RepID=UPI003806E9B9
MATSRLSTRRVEWRVQIGTSNKPAQGLVIFEASVSYIPDPLAAGGPRTAIPEPVAAVLDAGGYASTPDPTNPAKAGARGVELFTTDTLGEDGGDWTWTARPQLRSVNGIQMADSVPAFSFAVPTGTDTLDLAKVQKVPASPGIGEAQAVALLSQYKSDVDSVVARANAGSFKGEPGLPGVNAVPADEAVAQYASREDAKTNAAIKAVAQPVAEEVSRRPAGLRPPQPLAVFSFDDGVAADRDFVRPLLNNRGVKGTFGVTTNNVGNSGRLSWPDIKTLMDEGHEIASHAKTHKNLNTSDASLITAEIDEAHAAFLAQGIVPQGFVWPFAASSPASRAKARRLYKYALGGNAGTKQPIHTYAIKRVEITPTSTLANHKAQIDAAITDRELLVFLVHAADWNGTGFDKIGQVIDYARTVQLPIVTASEAVDLVGNIVDTGDLPGGKDWTVVTGSGVLNASSTGPVGIGPAGVSVTARPDSFPDQQETPQTFSAVGNDGWPGGSSGTVYTQRFGNHIAYTRQVVYTGAGSVYYRTAVDVATWSAFTRLDNGNITTVNTPNGNAPVTAFDIGTTITRLTNPGSTGPNGQAGTLTTNRPHLTQHGYAYQEFNVFGSNTFLRRGCASDGSWLPWVTLTAS